MLLCPNTKHPTELRWSPKASQGLQVPGLMTSPHFLCATPLKYIKHFAPAAACARWLPAPEKRPAQLPPTTQRVSQYLPLRYQKVATARFLRCSATRWWSLNKQPDELTPNILGSLWAAFVQTTETFKQAL